MSQLVPNKFYTYLKKVDHSPGGDKFHVLHYTLHLESNYHSLHWDAPNPGMRTISFGVYEWNGVDDPHPQQNNKTIVLRVGTGTGINKIATTGVIVINDINFKPQWAEMSVNLDIRDENGGPIGGNGSTVHYGDAD